MRKTINVPAACRERFASLGDALLAPWARAGLTRAGVSRVVDGYHIVSPAHADGIVIVTMGGAGTFTTRRAALRATAGTVALCPPLKPVIFACTGAEWHFAWCYLDARRWSMPADVTLSRWPRAAAWSSCLEGALDLVATARDVRPRGIRLQVDLILDDLRALLGHAGIDEPGDPYEEAWQQVIESVQEAWPVARFAALVKASVPTVQRWAQRRFACSFHQQLLTQRLDQAAQILLASEYTLAQVAALVGFADAFTFSAAFRRRRGLAPSQWRAQQG